MPWNYRENFKINIEMTSDWHIGSGNSRGDIDSLVQKDRDGLPYIPAKTLTGILRDSAELVAKGLDSGEPNGIWQQWVDVLFGDQPALAQSPQESPPRPAALSIRSAHLLESLKNALVAKPQLKEALSFIKPGVAIDLTSGCATYNFLRFEEMVRKGTILEAQECQLILPNATDDQKKMAYALLIAAAKMVERLGGKRRRGSGLCKITIDSDPQPCLEWLSQQENPLTPVEYILSNDPINNTPTATSNEWHTLDLKIVALSPIVINSSTVGNVVETLDYIPGKYLLPILHKKLGELLNIHLAIANTDLIVTNATIAINNKPSRPTPFCLSAQKVNGGLEKGLVYNLLVEPEPEGIQLKGIRGGYLGQFEVNSPNLPVYQKVDINVYTHNTIKDDVQRPTEDLGGIYSYEAISAGTVLQAELRLKKTLADRLSENNKQRWEQLNGKYRIGQSKKDDYGLIKLTVTKSNSLAQSVPTINQNLYVWLLSDVLLRNERLRPTAELDELRKQLEIALGVKLQERKNDSLISVSARQTRTDSWQTRWGLARPTLAGLQAGTTIVYEVEGSLNPNLLAKLQLEGIGERRAEGYGQICFNDPLLTSKMFEKKPVPKTTSTQSNNNTVITDKDKGSKYARIIEIAAWRAQIERKALAIATHKAQRQEILGIEIRDTESCPSMSQLGGLKSKILKLQKTEDKEALKEWIKALKESNREDKWPKGSLILIKKLIEDEKEIWRYIEISNDLTLTKNGEQELKQKLWAEAVRTLIDACIRAHKRDWEKAQPNSTQTNSTQTSEIV